MEFISFKGDKNMPLSMPFDPKRKKMIRQSMNKQEEDAGGKERLERRKLRIKGQSSLQPIYSFDTNDLVFNKANGRIKAEVSEKESELGRQLDIFDKEDQKIIKAMLLAIRTEENEKIKADIEKAGQENPGIITCDGRLINGNRRKAIIEELYEETKDDKFRYIDVHVLPSDIAKDELWLIEAGIQMSAPQQLDYSPINHLLKLREGERAGLKPDEMASRIYGYSKDDLEKDLQRLTLIDEYLRSFLQKEDRYYLVNGLNEHFIDLQNNISWAQHPTGRIRRDWTWDESDINELKLVSFYFIRKRMPHMRVRDIRNLFATKGSWIKTRKALDVELELTKQEKTEIGLPGITEKEQEDDYEPFEETEGITTTFEERDHREEVYWRQKRGEELKSIYEDAKEQEQIVKDSEKPLALARRALKNISAIPKKQSKLKEPEMDNILSKIIKETNSLRKIIKKQITQKKKVRRKNRR
ncbi:MAG: hypothetical protein WBC05_05195 [Sedimentisphaerales bacterium]